MKKQKYTYLVSFLHAGGHGSSIVKTSFKIRTSENLKTLKVLLESSENLKSVAFTNFILMDTDWGFWEWFKSILEFVLLLFLVLCSIAAIFG